MKCGYWQMSNGMPLSKLKVMNWQLCFILHSLLKRNIGCKPDEDEDGGMGGGEWTDAGTRSKVLV